MLLMEGSTLYGVYETGENNLYRFYVNNFGHNEGISYLFSKWLN